MKAFKLLCILIVFTNISIQGNTIDSLVNLLDQYSDSAKVSIYQYLIHEYQDVDFEKSLYYGESGISYADSKNNEIWKARIFHALGNVYHKKSNFEKSIEYFEKSRDLFLKHNYTDGIFSIYNNLGTAYQDMGKYAKSLEYLLNGLKLAEDRNIPEDIALVCNNIGLVYYYQDEYEKALNYYERSLKIRSDLGDKRGVALAYNNIGIIYFYLDNKDKVIEYFLKALTMYEELNDLRGQSLPLYNIAEIYYEQGKYDKALEYYQKSMEIDKKVGDKGSVAMNMFSIGEVYVAQGKYSKAIEFQKDGLEIAQKIGAIPLIKDGYSALFVAYEKAGNFKEALSYHKQYVALNDSIFNTQKAKQLSEIETKYEAEKKQEQIELLEKEKAIDNLEIERNEQKIKNQKILLYTSLLGIFAVLLFVIILYRQILQKQKINNLLSQKLSEIDDTNKKLKVANEEINKSTKQKEKFFANTSHELRNPLNVVIGFTNLLLKTELNELQKKYLYNIKKSGNNLLVVINDLLTHSKIEAGKLKLEYIDFDLVKEVENQLLYAQQKAMQKNITIEIPNLDSLPQFVKGDPVRLIQILSNLLNNAIKFTDYKGRIEVNVEVISNTSKEVDVQFSIKDNGIGISSDKIKYIFDSFTQANYDTTRKYGGTGLGLAIVKSLVELHGGNISVESKINEGSKFTFNLNFKPGHENKTEEEEKETGTQLINKSLKLLLVEDDPINITLAIDTFTLFNNTISIDTALNGKVAIEMIQKKEYDVVIMDIQMPVMDGYQATNFIRTKLPSPKNNIPILGMSAYAMKEEIDKCFEFGMNEYITKPFAPEDLFNKLNQLTQKNIVPDINIIPEKKIDYLSDRYPPKLLEIYKNDIEKIDGILHIYLLEIPQKIKEMKDHAKNNGVDSIKKIAHSLKTSFKLINEDEASEKSRQIEVGEIDDNDIAKEIDAIEKFWEIRESLIRELLDNKKATS